MLDVKKIPNTGIGNPFHYDAYRMGQYAGENVAIMFEKHPNETQPYIVVVNTTTGERVMITLDDSIRTMADAQTGAI